MCDCLCKGLKQSSSPHLSGLNKETENGVRLRLARISVLPLSLRPRG